MKKVTMILIIAATVFFVIGMIAGNYHCGAHFCNTITSAVNLAADLVKTEAKGITTVVGGIARVFG
jgi:uncharacterized protein YabE (DUF348 family)